MNYKKKYRRYFEPDAPSYYATPNSQKWFWKLIINFWVEGESVPRKLVQNLRDLPSEFELEEIVIGKLKAYCQSARVRRFRKEDLKVIRANFRLMSLYYINGEYLDA